MTTITEVKFHHTKRARELSLSMAHCEEEGTKKARKQGQQTEQVADSLLYEDKLGIGRIIVNFTFYEGDGRSGNEPLNHLPFL